MTLFILTLTSDITCWGQAHLEISVSGFSVLQICLHTRRELAERDYYEGYQGPNQGPNLLWHKCRWIGRHRSACSTQPSKNSGWDISTVGAYSQKSVYSGERRDESFLLRLCALKIQAGNIQSLSPKHPVERRMVAVLKVNKMMYPWISGKAIE